MLSNIGPVEKTHRLSTRWVRSYDSRPELELGGFRFFDRHYIFFLTASAAS